MAHMMKATVGKRPRITITITDYDDALINPITFFVQVEDPSGNVATYTHPDATITVASTGIYRFTIPVAFDEVGLWKIEAHSTTPDAVESWLFNVGPQRIP